VTVAVVAAVGAGVEVVLDDTAPRRTTGAPVVGVGADVGAGAVAATALTLASDAAAAASAAAARAAAGASVHITSPFV
jgi:hypothetical protein